MEPLLTEYREVCQNHRAVTDFRAKLLALLPVASGAGIYLLLNDRGGVLDTRHLPAVGLFGILVTLGLFFYEHHAMEQCWDLLQRGAFLEHEMGLTKGQFGVQVEKEDAKRWPQRLVGPEGAAWVIYITTMGAWLYVTMSGGWA